MNNTIMRKIDVTADWQSLSDEQLVGTVDVSTPPGNADSVLFKGDDGSEVPWVPGEYHTLKSVNLAEIFIKGTPGDTVSVVGGSW